MYFFKQICDSKKLQLKYVNYYYKKRLQIVIFSKKNVKQVLFNILNSVCFNFEIIFFCKMVIKSINIF